MASNTRSNGDGSVYWDEGRQRYVAQLVTGWRNGRPVYKRRTATSKTKAAARLRELREDVAKGNVMPTTKAPTVAEWMDYWLENIVAKTRRPSTYHGYRSKADQYIIPLLGHHRLDKLTPEHVEQAWDELLEVGNPIKAKGGTAVPLSSTTAHSAHMNLRRALVIAMQRRRVTHNVCMLMEPPPVAQNDVSAMSVAEARAVLAFCKDLRNGARWSVALSLGLRQGEALGLTWDDIDLESRRITVRRALARVRGNGLVLGSLKSKAANRTFTLPREMVAPLREHRKQQAAERVAAGTWWESADLVFCQPDGRPIDPRKDWQTWQDICAGAGVRKYRLHDARHTAATLMLLQGVSDKVAADILGHSMVSMTHKYQHVHDVLLEDASVRMGAALWG